MASSSASGGMIDELRGDLADEDLEREALVGGTARGFLCLQALGDVQDGRHHEQSRIAPDRIQTHFDRKLGAVRAARQEGAARAHLAGQRGGQVLLAQRDVALTQRRRNQMLDRPTSELLLAVAKNPLGFAVREQDDAAIVDDHHPQRRGVHDPGNQGIDVDRLPGRRHTTAHFTWMCHGDIAILVRVREPVPPSAGLNIGHTSDEEYSGQMESRSPVRVQSRSLVHSGRIFRIEVDTVTLPTGHTLDMEIVRHPGSVVLLPMPSPNETHPHPPVPLFDRPVYLGAAGRELEAWRGSGCRRGPRVRGGDWPGAADGWSG